MNIELSIVIVNYKTPKLTYRCIDSINKNYNSNNYEIIVVDNNSGDESKELITSSFLDVKWIDNSKNDGFGRANNIGINHSKGKYILLLNSDILVPKETIESCLNEIKKDAKIGVLGCKLLNEDGSIQKSTYPYIADYEGVI